MDFIYLLRWVMMAIDVVCIILLLTREKIGFLSFLVGVEVGLIVRALIISQEITQGIGTSLVIDLTFEMLWLVGFCGWLVTICTTNKNLKKMLAEFVRFDMLEEYDDDAKGEE